jgi:sigma-B regulation protein RsbU (phosphoserine phosphatase)
MEGVQMAVAPAANAEIDGMLHQQLLDRRTRLESVQARVGVNSDFSRLLGEVDAALARFENGSYGLCEVCHDSIEPERLMADPLMRVCLGDLTDKQRHNLEDDLELAAAIQKGLLPTQELKSHFTTVDFIYHPAGIVSGDYCDVITHDGEVYFVLGDVSGKGVAASLLMSNLHAMFRLMVPLGLPLHELMVRANRLFCESTMANQYATLVFGKINEKGEAEMYNAGHLAPILIKNGDAVAVESSGLPLGMFCDSDFTSSTVKLEPGETILLYSDGVTEACDRDGNEFTITRLLASVKEAFKHGPTQLVQQSLTAVEDFCAGAAKTDDLTILALKYAG